MWDTSCPDWERRLRDQVPLVPDLPLFESEADRGLRIFKRLRLPDVVGTPTLEEACGEWFFAIVRAVFGSLDPVTMRRMIQEFFLLVPKKNSKSSYGGLVMLTGMLVNRRPRAPFLFIAPTKKIADNSYDIADGAIALDSELKKIFRTQDHLRKITHLPSDSTLEILAADTDTITGGKQLATLIDETHEFASKKYAAKVFLELRGALAARPDGFLMQITTQSKEPPSGVFRSELYRARRVRDGEERLPLLPILYEFPKSFSHDGRWKDEQHWPMVNPNLNRSVDIEFLRRELSSAEYEGEAQLRLFASQHFNVEIGLGLRSDRWAGAGYWERRAIPGLTLGEVIDRSDVVIVGIDGGGLDDLFGLVALGRDRETRDWIAWCHAWCHEDVLERRKSIASKLEDCRNEGSLTIVGDELADVSEIVEVVRQVLVAGKLGKVAVDPAGLGELVDALDEIGVTQEADLVVGVPQGYAMMNAIKTTERKLTNGTLWHCGTLLMAWCVSNLKIEPMATAIRATKQNAGDAKIDPVMALFDAAFVMATNPEPAGGSYLDDEELITL